MSGLSRGYHRIIYVTGIALILITLGIETFQYRSHQNIILRDLKNRLDEHAMNISLRAETKGKPLLRIMGRFPSLEGSLFLIDKASQVLATQGTEAPLLNRIPKIQEFVSPKILQKIFQEMAHPSGGFISEGPSLIYVTPVNQLSWYMVYVGSKDELFQQIFVEAILGIFVIALLLIFVMGMSYLIVISYFISPAQKLVQHIEKENKGVKSDPQNIPQRWRPWFNIVSRIFAENRTLMVDLENRVKLRTKQLQQKNHQLEKTLTDLKKAQNQIIVQEKLASLGALTAGIAHEIKNPLNFIINFSDLSLEYLQELKEKTINENKLFYQIEQNMRKTREHAERADSIVKGMLAHARGSTGEIIPFNLNKLLDEAIELAYIGFQSKKHYFTAKITKKYDHNIVNIQGSKQDLVRVFLNIINNACFAMHEKQEKLGKAYKPELIVSTQDRGEIVKISFEDNGPGMSRSIIKKIFVPFFTTKDAGIGTGLGLSLSYDIIAHQHHGHISVKSSVGDYSRFIIELKK